MRVVILCLSASRGGLELYVLQEAEQLISKGHECLPIVSKDSYLESELIRKNLPYFVLAVANRRLPLLATKKLAEQVDRFRPDLLHFHWVDDLNLVSLSKAWSKHPFSLVYTRHMNYTRSKKDIFHRWFYQKIDLFIVGTRLLRDQVKQYIPISRDRVKLLYIGVAKPDLDIPDCKSIFTDRFPKRTLNIAVFGRIEEGKGQHLVVRAVNLLNKQKNDISLTMIGHTMDQSYHDNLISEIDTNQQVDHIQFIGFMENATSLMPCFDLVILSTNCETFGMVLVEAMRAGVAVIGTNAGGVPEIIEHNICGMLVEPKSVAAMKRAIEELYNNPKKLKNMAKTGQARADKYFSAETHFSQLEQTLEKLVK